MLKYRLILAGSLIFLAVPAFSQFPSSFRDQMLVLAPDVGIDQGIGGGHESSGGQQSGDGQASSGGQQSGNGGSENQAGHGGQAGHEGGGEHHGGHQGGHEGQDGHHGIGGGGHEHEGRCYSRDAKGDEFWGHFPWTSKSHCEKYSNAGNCSFVACD